MSEMMLTGSIFVGISCLTGAIMGGIAAYLLFRLNSTRNWQTTAGQVLASRVVVVGTSEGRTEEPRVVYAYTVGGQQYQGDRIFVGGAMSGLGAQKTVDRYPEGRSVQVHYNPDKPQEAVLERRSPVAIFLIVFGFFMTVIFCGVGAGLIYYGR